MAKEKLRIRVVEYNNKSRKGTYIAIKIGKGPERAYKERPDVPYDVFVDHYKAVYTVKGTKRKKVRKTLQRRVKEYKEVLEPKRIRKVSKTEAYVKQIRKMPDIGTLLKRGVSKATIGSVKGASNKTVRSAKRKLIKHLIREDKYLDMLMTPENFKKYAMRLEYHVAWKDQNGAVLATSTVFNKLPETVIQELREIHAEGSTIEGSDPERNWLARIIKDKGYNKMNFKKVGKVAVTEVTMILRKGK